MEMILYFGALYEIGVYDFKVPALPKWRQIFHSTGGKIIDYSYFVPKLDEVRYQMAPNKSSSTGYYNAHKNPPYKTLEYLTLSFSKYSPYSQQFSRKLRPILGLRCWYISTVIFAHWFVSES